MKEHDVFKLLEKRYPSSEYALFPQVPDGTGSTKVRTADAICMSLWPSRGLEIEGFEIKASRADWLKELNGDPAKAESWAKHCNRWWIVAPAKVVKKGELPLGWGLLTFSESGIRKAVHAPLRENVIELSRAKIAGLFRAARRYFDSDGAAVAAKRGEFDKGVEAGKTIEQCKSRALQRDHDRLLKSVAEFETASGVKIDQFRGGQQGEAFARFMAGEQRDSAIRSAAKQMLVHAERLTTVLRKVEQ